MRGEWRVAVAVIAGLNLLGWGLLLTAVVPSGIHYAVGGSTALAVGLAAYALGMRHAFDADHIAAIDNTTRRLVDRGRPAATVGLWFSLGHSTVVVLLCAALSVGLGAAAAAIAADDSGVHRVAGVWGPTVSAVFLLAIAAINVWSIRQARRGTGGAPPGGPVWWLMRRFESVVDRPSRMFGVGFAFGLGFDTATEVGLLAIAGTATLGRVPWWAVMTLPVLFAAGMAVADTAQGAVMRRAYAWRTGAGDGRPRRRAVTYAVVMTGLSAAAAVAVATVQLAGVGTETLGWGGVVARVGAIDLESAGIGLTVALLVIWVVAAIGFGIAGRRRVTVS
ncbi:HoxN/HupN/NixA family nickel/cobalt transporter [Gordonia crocea]|uniref:Nickel/cobalt efflux system n=1 Tax=Gordonia crocea TaxID=589162 RepID=A0A7I9V2N9_9ACTN|nr:high-affinity nickel-transport protein [Gordonia crocea]GED99441.1 nickel/cobalt efflux system [Gordonia crocea]